MVRMSLHVGYTGHCGVTSDGGDCERGELGAWAATHDLSTITGCARHCLLNCKRCTYISFEPGRADCSWYANCPRLQWRHGGLQYRTLQVRPGPVPGTPRAIDIRASSALPHVTVRNTSIRTHSFPGYCALMGPELGDCEQSEQGSWAGVSGPRECQARCRQCRNCNFISFTHKHELVAQRSPHHAPSWWGCRWYARCDLTDLRQRGSSDTPYFTRRVRKPYRGKHRGTATLSRTDNSSASATTATTAGLATNASTSTSTTSMGLRLALVTLLAHDPDWKRYGGVDARCAMAQWCENARRLIGVLPHNWRIDLRALGAGRDGGGVDSGGGDGVDAGSSGRHYARGGMGRDGVGSDGLISDGMGGEGAIGDVKVGGAHSTVSTRDARLAEELEETAGV